MAPIDARNKLEQIRRNKLKSGKKDTRTSTNGNVRDLRQLIGSRRKSGDKVQVGRITKSAANGVGGPRDLRDSNRKLAARKSVISQSTPRGAAALRNDGKPLRKSERVATSSRFATSIDERRANTAVAIVGPRAFRSAKKPQQQYYVPPHIQAQHPPATYIIAPTAAAPQSKLAMDSVPEIHQTGASVLVSNLMPTITQSEIIELFGDVGVMNAVNMINQTTALVTYQNGRDAVEAVKVYHNRLLDGKPMFVYMMPNAATSSSIRSRIQ